MFGPQSWKRQTSAREAQECTASQSAVLILSSDTGCRSMPPIFPGGAVRQNPVMTVDRIAPPAIGGEREMLRAFLDYHRATLAMKCEGLSDDDLRRAAVPSSACPCSASYATWPRSSGPGSAS